MCRRPVSVCLSVCLSQVGVLSKRLNVGRQFLLHSDYFTKFAVSELMRIVSAGTSSPNSEALRPDYDEYPLRRSIHFPSFVLYIMSNRTGQVISIEAGYALKQYPLRR